MRVVPLFGSGVFGKSAVVTRQRRLNCYYEMRPDGDKGTKVVVYGTPGLSRVGRLESGGNSPARALLGSDTAFYAVVYNQFQSLNTDYAILFQANVGTSSGLASIAASPSNTGSAHQVMVVDGAAGYVYSPNLATFATLAAAWFVPGAKTVTNVGGYFVCEQPGTPNFVVSNLNDATTGSALSVASASAYPDVLRAVDNLGGNLILFGGQHMEFWQPIGTPPPSQPFAAVQSATNEWGLAAVFSRAHVADGLAFLGQTRQGARRVVLLKGYGCAPISEEIDAIINAPGFVYADAEALTYQVDQHPFYQLTFPTMGRSFLYDFSSGIWGEAQTGVSAQAHKRHRGSLSTYHRGESVLSDFEDGRLYVMRDNVFTDDGEKILREVITRHATKDFNRFRVPLVYLDMETGVGQGFNPTIAIDVSKDDGRTWSIPRLLKLGAIGEYLTRIVARRWGQAKTFTWRIRMTDPAKFVITNGAIEVKGRK